MTWWGIALLISGTMPDTVRGGTATAVSRPLLTIEQAIRTTLEENPDIGMARDAVKMARESLRETRALFRPTITLSGEYSTGDAPSAYLFKTIDQRKLPQNTDFNDPGTFTNLETGIALQWNLYRGGQDRIDTRMAHSGIAIHAADQHTMENQMVSAVIHLFFAVLKAGAHEEIARQSVETVKTQLSIMETRYRAGGVLKSDILSLKVRLAAARQQWVHLQNLHAITRTALFNVMGRPVDHQVELSKTCICPFTFPDTVEEACAAALEKRPEMIRATTALDQARLALDRTRSAYRPQVDLRARYYFDNEDPTMDLDQENYTAALSVNWSLYSGGGRAARCARAGIALAQAEKNKKKTALAITEEVHRAWGNHEDALKRYEVARTSVEMADESLILVKKRYEGGSESVTRYLEAELARHQERINRATAFYDEKAALSDIARSMGILSDIWKQEVRQ